MTQLPNSHNSVFDRDSMGSRWDRFLHPTLSVTYVSIFAIGIACMAVAGYFLIEGLSEFSGSTGAKRMLIVGGILFQITESICFIAAASLTAHSLRWRYILFSLGLVLFCFSIGVMTLAQKTALQSGEAQAQAIDEKRAYLRKQITSLENVISSYRLNAEKQSKSIFKDSRALGQDSLNRATELEQKKFDLSQQLFILTEKRRQTSSDFFKRFEEISGLPAKQTEFYFLVLRSLLLELCGIILMSFSANLRAYNLLITNLARQQETKPPTENPVSSLHEQENTQAIEENPTTEVSNSVISAEEPIAEKHELDTPQLFIPSPVEFDIEQEDDTEIELEDNWAQDWASPKLRAKKLKSAGVSETELQILSSHLTDLHEQGIIRGFSPSSIRRNLKDHCRKTVNQEVANILSRILKSRQEA